MSRIAVMQPYFLPYAGYFRLMVDVDAFVVGDVQQFPRRGWVHRNRLLDDAGMLRWLTLPLNAQPLGARIRDIRFAEGAQLALNRNMARFRACRRPAEATAPILSELGALKGQPVDVILRLVDQVARVLDLRTPIVMQSAFHDEADLEAMTPTEQIADICGALGAREYVNAPGGRALYDGDEFRRHGLKLLFLDPYPGPHSSVLQRLADEPPEALRREVVAGATTSAA